MNTSFIITVDNLICIIEEQNDNNNNTALKQSVQKGGLKIKQRLNISETT